MSWLSLLAGANLVFSAVLLLFSLFALRNRRDSRVLGLIGAMAGATAISVGILQAVLAGPTNHMELVVIGHTVMLVSFYVGSLR